MSELKSYQRESFYVKDVGNDAGKNLKARFSKIGIYATLYFPDESTSKPLERLGEEEEEEEEEEMERAGKKAESHDEEVTIDHSTKGVDDQMPVAPPKVVSSAHKTIFGEIDSKLIYFLV